MNNDAKIFAKKVGWFYIKNYKKWDNEQKYNIINNVSKWFDNKIRICDNYI